MEAFGRRQRLSACGRRSTDSGRQIRRPVRPASSPVGWPRWTRRRPRGADPDQVAAGAAALGPPDAAVAGEALVAQVVDAEALDPDLDRGRPRQVQVDEPGRELQVDRDLGRRVAEADGQAGDARLDGDAAQVELGQVQVGGDRARRDVDPPGQGGVELDPPVVAAVAGQHPPLGGARRSSTARSAAVVTWVLGRPGPRSSAAYRPGASGSIRSWPPPSSARSSARFAPAGTGWLAVAMTAGSEDSDSASADHGHHQQQGADGAQRAPAGAAADPLQPDAGEGQGMASRTVWAIEVTRVARVATVMASPAASTTRPVQ